MLSKIIYKLQSLSYKVVFALGLIIFILAGLYISAVYKKTQFDAGNILSEVSVQYQNDMFTGLREELKTLVDKWGVEGAYDLIEEAFVSDQIGIFECHTLDHLLGHHAVIEYGDDVEKILALDTNFCELGYRHGVEAQIAIEGGNYEERLYSYCDAMRGKFPGVTCFHGAGHAFMNELLDLDAALKMCETLSDFEYKDINECYLGVFAEYTNLVGGYDGELGIPYEGDPPLSIEGTPIDYCANLDKKYQVACVRELSGLGNGKGATAAHITDSLHTCVKNDHPFELQDACLFAVSALRAQHEVPVEKTVLMIPDVLTFSEQHRQSYIRGGAGELYQYVISGSDPDWQSFCNSFAERTDVSYCESVVLYGI